MKVVKSIFFALLYFLLFYSGQFAASMAYEFYLMSTGIGMEEMVDTIYSNINMIAIIGNIVSTAVAVIILLIRKKKINMEIGIHRTDPMLVVLGALIGFGGTVVVSILMNIIPFSQQMWDTYEESIGQIVDTVDVISIISTVIVAPIVEEFFFRGLIFSRLARGMNIYVAALISSVIFGVAHGNVIQGTYAFLFGLLLCFVYIKARSLWASVAVHVTFNSFSFVIDAIDTEAAQYGLMAGSLMMFIIASVFFIIYRGNFPQPKTAATAKCDNPLEHEPPISYEMRTPDVMNLYMTAEPETQTESEASPEHEMPAEHEAPSEPETPDDPEIPAESESQNEPEIKKPTAVYEIDGLPSDILNLSLEYGVPLSSDDVKTEEKNDNE